jgi:TonB-dependent SusC/RagA subfamily outer membrane receptor
MKKIIIVLMGVFFSVSIFAQNRVINGKVTVFNTYPVKNIEVTAKKAKTSVRTDSLGQFSIVCFENDVLKLKPKTFQPVNEKVGPEIDSISINLLFIDSKPNREKVVLDGYITEEDLTYGINNLSQQSIDYCKYTDIFQLIRSEFSGVTISGGSVYIRGSGSFSGQTQALIIVNGSSITAIDWIQPCQIKSINILKDNEAAIYGTRGGNGVVVIETKN